jgi:hypothetical protein
MPLPQRLRVVIPGGAAVAVAGVLGAWSSAASFFANPTMGTVAAYVAAVLLAPVVLLVNSLPLVAGGPVDAPAYLRVVAAVALAASPAHAVMPSPGTRVLSIVGFAAWLLCELILVGATA